MAIKIEDANALPGIQYDRIHLVRLDIRQHDQKIDKSPSVFDIKIKFRYYGVDENGMRHYKHAGIQQLSVDDFLSLAREEAEKGNMTLLSTFATVQEGIAEMIKIKLGLNNTVI